VRRQARRIRLGERRAFGRGAAREVFQNARAEAVQRRLPARELELVGGFAQNRVAEDAGESGVPMRILRDSGPHAGSSRFGQPAPEFLHWTSVRFGIISDAQAGRDEVPPVFWTGG
jgi:hypothetical protein